MLVRLELNVALARINPLFYRQIRVFITDQDYIDFHTSEVDAQGRPTGRMVKESAK